MKLFSSNGRHNADSTKNTKTEALKHIAEELKWTANDFVIALVIALYATLLCGWFISPVFAESGAEVTTEAEAVECVEISDEIEEQTVAQVDETLALAVGIDAVISSIPNGDLASDVTMLMVGNTIMNRVHSSSYPDSVEEVLCQPKQFSCFSDTGLKWVGKAAHDEAWKARCMAAAERAINGERMLSPAVVNVSSSKVGTVEAQLDGLYFCR